MVSENKSSLKRDTDEILHIHEVNETYYKLASPSRSLLSDISDYFTFEAPNAQYDKRVKYGVWDGKIRLVNGKNKFIYRGLKSYIIEYCKRMVIPYHFHENDHLNENRVFFDNYFNTLKTTFSPYDFQKNAFEHCINSKRATILSPTSSGKSFIIYTLTRWLLENVDKKILILVPSIDLVGQLTDEFIEYDKSFKIENHIKKIYGGQTKNTNKKIICSTWQSVHKEDESFFSDFDAIICDECHQMKASCIKAIYEKAINSQYRFGFTGTLDGMFVNRLVIEGLTGPVFSTVTTKELIDRKITSDLDIRCVTLKYESEKIPYMKYPNEMEFIVSHNKRNNIITNIIRSIEGKNALILTAYIEHINILAPLLESIGKKVYVVYGDIDKDTRETIRKNAETENDIVILATYGTYSTGISIKNLQYILFATGSKSQIRVLQSIGRGLRKDGKSNLIKIIDIIDDFHPSVKEKNHLYKHFFERLKIYINQKFKYNIRTITL